MNDTRLKRAEDLVDYILKYGYDFYQTAVRHTYEVLDLECLYDELGLKEKAMKNLLKKEVKK